MNIKDNWDKELSHENVFWRQWFKEKGITWGEDYDFRMDRNAPLQSHLHDCLPDRTVVSILDVGSGPLTVLGKKHPGKEILIMCVDPAADEYHKILHENNIIPQIPVVYGVAEQLTEFLEPNKFDIVYCQNALDHSYDPIVALHKMLTVCKPGGFIVLYHENNEAENERYLNLHQWNFCEKNNSFIIWNKQSNYNVTEIMKYIGEVKIETIGAYNIVKIKKI